MIHDGLSYHLAKLDRNCIADHLSEERDVVTRTFGKKLLVLGEPLEYGPLAY